MATLKISDLSVGDWVRWKVYDKTYDVCISQITDILVRGIHDGIEYGMKITQLSSIPITAEILERNGLFRHEGDADYPQRIVLSNHFVMARTYTDVDWWRVQIYDEEIAGEELFNGIIYSVHQLQHALRLAGVDKEINL